MAPDDLTNLRKQILADGQLSNKDVDQLRDYLFSDGGMTKEKGEFLFDIKNLLSKEKVTPQFGELFVEAITSLLLDDENSPGEIDESEAKWVRAKVQMKGYHDRLDRILLDNLRRKSINFPQILNYKSNTAKAFEYTLYFSRYLTLFAVISSLISSLALFIRGSMVVIYGLIDFFSSFSIDKAEDYEKLLVAFVSSVDIFLFAMVLLIFGMGIYELFVSKIDPVEKKVDSRPSWLQIKSIDELKSSLGKVILMVLIVSFFKHSLDVSFSSSKDLLFLAVGVLLIAAALYLANRKSKTS